MSDAPVRLLVLTNSLHFGGAEKHSVGLLNLLDRRAFAPAAMWLHPDTALLPQLDTARLAGAGCLERAHGPRQQHLADAVVVACLDDQEARAGRRIGRDV